MGHAEFLHAAKRGVLPEETHDHGFTVQHRDDGNTNVDVHAFQPEFDATVLREAFLGNVQVAENFDAGNDRGLKAFDAGGNGDSLEDAVHTVTDAEFVLERFDVNVRRAEFDGVLEHLVDEADDRGVFRGGIEIAVVFVLDDLKGGFLVEFIKGIGATPRCFLISPPSFSLGARTGSRLSPVRDFKVSIPSVAKRRLVAIRTEPFSRSKGNSSSLSRTRAGKRESSSRSGSTASSES